MHYGIANLKSNFKHFQKSGEYNLAHFLHRINFLLVYKLK